MGAHHFVATAVLVKSDKVLLCHRHPNRQWYPDVWDVPGGHIDVGETPVEAVRRELLEELGVEILIESDQPFRVYGPAPDLTLYAWVVTEWSGEVANLAPDEHDDIAWFSVDELQLLELADPAIRGLVSDAIDQAARRS
jgi:8-oxo-dGTP diphosphatase